MGHIYPGAHTLNPYIAVTGAEEAIAFYKKVFGAVEKGRLIGPNGVIAHAEISIEGSLFMLAEENKEWGNLSPTTLGGTACTLVLYFPDADAVFQKAVEAGSTVLMPMGDAFYGDRTGSVKDPFGHQWMISTHKEEVSFEELQKRMESMGAQQ
jgi:PhnB protein